MQNKRFPICKVCLGWMLDHPDLPDWKRCSTCRYSERFKSYMISYQDWSTSSGRYPDRAKSKELTEDVKKNAEDLLKRVNDLLKDLGEDGKKDISSGFRTSAANAATANAAKKSAHMTGKAIDIMDDKEQTLAKKIEARPDLLKKHGLMMEHKDHTKGKNTNWVHLDTVARSPRASQVFKP